SGRAKSNDSGRGTNPPRGWGVGGGRPGGGGGRGGRTVVFVFFFFFFLAPRPEKTKNRSTPRSGHGRQRLPPTLERRRVVYDLGEQERQCPQCQGELRRIGEEISERLEHVPASLQVIEEACQKYACTKGCTVVTAAKPMQPIEKGLAGPGLLAQGAVNKFSDHLPPHRQEAIFARHG